MNTDTDNTILPCNVSLYDNITNVTLIQAQATKFICAACGKVAEPCTCMTECRVKMWRSKTGKSGASSVKLCPLPPTNDAFVENINHQQWTQQVMDGKSTTRACCYHEQCQQTHYVTWPMINCYQKAVLYQGSMGTGKGRNTPGGERRRPCHTGWM